MSSVTTTIERFLAMVEFVDKRHDNGIVNSRCLEWTCGKSDGYGRINILTADRKKSVRVHRYAWERWMGAIPEDREIDHVCRNRACVNVTHMELVTTKENILGSEGMGARSRLKG